MLRFLAHADKASNSTFFYFEVFSVQAAAAKDRGVLDSGGTASHLFYCS